MNNKISDKATIALQDFALHSAAEEAYQTTEKWVQAMLEIDRLKKAVEMLTVQKDSAEKFASELYWENRSLKNKIVDLGKTIISIKENHRESLKRIKV